ncbi:MAG: lipase family protein [Alphaproteobacteria bacterium]|nr:MAG: lipase family protein [Alphaproteobacteria bacterium]
MIFNFGLFIFAATFNDAVTAYNDCNIRTSVVNAMLLTYQLIENPAVNSTEVMHKGLSENFWTVVDTSLQIKTGKHVDGKFTAFKSVVVASNQDYIIFAFPGTSDWKDVLTDAKFLPKNTGIDGAYAHMGFADAAESFRQQMEQKISALQSNKKKQVIFTGHSLGGANAAMCAVNCLDYFRKLYKRTNLSNNDGQIILITMGQPRVWCSDYFSRALRMSQILRLVARGITGRADIVTVLPPGYCEYGPSRTIRMPFSIFNPFSNAVLHSSDKYAEQILEDEYC